MLYKDREWLLKQIELGKCTTDIAKELNVDRGTINYWEKKLDIKIPRKHGTHRSNCFNEDFFENIDSEEKAYMLGFISADGYIVGERTLCINLHNKDEEILIRFCDLLNSEYKIFNKGDCYRVLQLNSKKMVNDLSKYGVVQNKTGNLKIPSIKHNLIRHYIRGVFDGDGHVGMRQCALVTGSKMFFEDFMKLYQDVFHKIPWFSFKDNTYTIQFSRRDMTFIKWMYEDAKISLSRKKNNYDLYWKTYQKKGVEPKDKKPLG